MAHRRNRSLPPRRRAAGLTLIEAMVALLVLSVGVIGVAVLHGQSLAASRSAIFRSQAISLASDMADRIRLNRAAQTAYEGSPSDKHCDDQPDPVIAACSPAERAADDLFDWSTAVAAGLPGGTGSVRVDTSTDPASYTVTVAWDEATESGRAALPLSFRLSAF